MSKVIISLDANYGSQGIESDDSSVSPNLVFLTELELSALVTIALNGMDAMGGKRPRDLLEDNMSWFNQTELTEGCAVSTMAARGVMTFLNRKGLVADAEFGHKGPLPKNPDGSVRDHWALTDSGIRAAQHAWYAAHNQQIDEIMASRRPALARLLALAVSK